MKRGWARVAGALGRSWREDRDRWALALCVLAVAVTLLRPSVPMTRALYDHVIVLDITQSMDVTDMQQDGRPVSRLVHAKQALRELLVRLPCGSKIGWGVFTEYRSFLLLAPLEVCANLDELRSTLGHIDGRMAWTGNSEIAKGLYSAVDIARQMPGGASLVFVTDGHEAPPLNPRHRPPFKGTPGEVPGLILGAGSPLEASPIPRSDPSGRPLGVWAAGDVLQTDPRSQGRGGSVGGERLVEDGADPSGNVPGATPGSEHLSSLREAYLRLLASETGLGYERLQDGDRLIAALTAPALARPVAARLDLRAGFAVLALVILLARHRHTLPLARRWRGRRGTLVPDASPRVQSPR